MNRRKLENKPLVEAIFEIRWKLKTKGQFQLDTHFQLLLARISNELLESDYSKYMELETAQIPSGIIGQVVQHQFQNDSDKWPLIQIGPGILTINDTKKYHWEDFCKRVVVAVDMLYKAHPNTKELEIESLMLRYVDAVEYDPVNEDAYEFLADKLKVSIKLPEALFEDGRVNKKPEFYKSEQFFSSNKPHGVVRLGLATGLIKENPAIIWETGLRSTDKLPDMPGDFKEWLNQAHDLVNDWFFKMINGELEGKFK
ncbi:TIGR04255 family protein [bacterium AH-315-I18]|nr:TIGR04255 family protein [Phycisphaeraceae bacterium]MBN4060855.1 TIGR04255 family protein [bacterium AH-315-I18]MBN4060873.1 TIGR04255 family protein [bacterium AH-315-I18]